MLVIVLISVQAGKILPIILLTENLRGLTGRALDSTSNFSKTL